MPALAGRSLLVLLLALCASFSALCMRGAMGQSLARPDADADEQYATVLVGAGVVPAPATQSTFIGILYLSVAPLGHNRFRLTTTLWHDVSFATTAYVKGPAARGHSGLTLFSLVPAGGSAESTACPIRTTTTLDATGINMLRSGEFYAEITSGAVPGGALRGQIEPRSDVYVAFVNDPALSMSDDNTTGLALVYASSIGQDPENPLSYVALDHWIVGRTGAGATFLGTDGGAGGNQTFNFGPGIASSAGFTTLFPTPTTFRSSAIQRRNLFVATPAFGTNSSRLSLVVQKDPGVNTFLGDFFRLPGARSLVPGVFGSGGGGGSAGSGSGSGTVNAPARWLSIVAAVAVVAVSVALVGL